MRKLLRVMKQKITKKLLVKKQLVLGVAFACAATASMGLTLGRARGAVLLGQPLNLTVAVQAETDESAGELCFDADVFYGDNRQEASRILVVPVRQPGGAPTGVRVTVSAPVDEPVVTVYLRSACGPKTSRKYVLLSDLASDLAPALSSEMPVRAARPQPQLSPPQLLTAAPTGSGSSPIAVTQPTQVGQSGSDTPRGSNSKKRVAPATAPKPATSVVLKQGSAKPRLKLSMLDLVDIKDPTLKLSETLLSSPSEDPHTREAASALWRSLNTSTQDLLKQDAQQKALANDLNSLRDLSARNQKDLSVLSERLQQSEAQRYANPLVYALGGFLLIALMALAALLLKLRGGNRNDTPWWRSEMQPTAGDSAYAQSAIHDTAVPTTTAVHADDHSTAIASGKPSPGTGVGADFSNSGLDIDLGLEAPVVVNLAGQSPGAVQRPEAVLVNSGTRTSSAVPSLHRDLSHSLHASLHAINTQEMLDVRQQADFFMTLGQHEEAIGLLEGSIRENEASNPLVYLDLLKVLHTLSRKPAFDHYRAEFNSIFTGRVPAYAAFGQTGSSLDAYPQICDEIAALWNTDSAVEFLEQCMVRRPEDAADLYFDLEAFRDLLLLHAMAGRFRLTSITDSGLMPFSAVKMALSPDASPGGSGLTPAGLSETTMPVAVVEPWGRDLTVDLDLSGDQDHNLIDFDPSSLSLPLKPRGQKD